MKALGAGNFAVAALFFAEAALLALLGGVDRLRTGSALAHRSDVRYSIRAYPIQPVLFP